MSRTATTFALVFADFVDSIGLGDVGDLSVKLKASLVREFNAAYRAAYSYKGVAWEDSWEDGALTPVDGYVPYADVDDAHVWCFYSTDPRPDSGAQWIESSTSSDGIFVGDTWDVGIYGFWRPKVAKWDGVAVQSFIDLLQDATLAFAQAEYYRTTDEYATSGARRKDAQAFLEDLAGNEFDRLQTQWWLRRRN